MRVVFIVFLVGFLLTAVAFGGDQTARDYGSFEKYKVKGQFLVRFADNVNLGNVSRGFGMYRIGIPSVDRTLDNYGAEEVRPLAPRDVGTSTPRSRFYVIRIAEGMDDERFLTAMRANPNIAEIQNDLMLPMEATPNDTNFGSQWHHYQVSDHDINSTDAWNVQTGSKNVVIAIIDTGVLYNHPDLRNSMWINPGEDLDGDRIVFDKTDFNNVDDDGNGYKDDVIGYDFVAGVSLPAWPGEDASVPDNDPADFNGHGTHCAGIAAAVSNNATGGAGIAGGWGPYIGDGGARIMALRVGYSANDGGQEAGLALTSTMIEAINYAVDNGADVISYSWSSSNVPGMTTALNAAMNAGIVFCNSAGNDNTDVPDYFGLFNGIITVAATNRYDVKWTWTSSAGSNYGTWVEVSAPGQDIYSTVSYHYSPTYATWTGTSMAAPMVSGLAALIKSHHPEFDKNEIDTIIMNNAHNIDAENPSYVGLLGTGRIDAWACLQNSPASPFTASPRVGQVPLTVNFDDQNAAAISRAWDFGDGEVSGDEDPVHEYLTPGMYNVSLEVTDPNGTSQTTRDFYICATADTLYGDPWTLVPSIATDSFPVPIYLKNSVPLTSIMLSFDWNTTSGDANLSFRGVSLEGTRGENFDTAIVRAEAPSSGKVAILLRAVDLDDADTDELPPGDGPIAKLWFVGSGTGTLAMDTVTLSGYDFGVESRYTAYLPESQTINIYTGMRGDANGDGFINTGDPVYLINYVFKSGAAPISEYNGDANGDGNVNVADAVYLINHIFKAGPPPPP